MERDELLTSMHLSKLGLKYRSGGYASGADSWQGLPFWTFTPKIGCVVDFRGTFSLLKLPGYGNSKITTVGELVDMIKMLTGELIDFKSLVI